MSWPPSVSVDRPSCQPPGVWHRRQRSPTEGASIAYQIDGAGLRPGHWLLYTGPFEAPAGALVTATAIRIGYAQSEASELTVR